MPAIAFIFIQSLLFYLTVPVSVSAQPGDQLSGAWQYDDQDNSHVLLFADGYFTYTAFDQKNKRFLQTKGGTYIITGSLLTVHYEFSTNDTAEIGKKVTYKAQADGNELTTDFPGHQFTFKQVDDGASGLYGLWKITDRKQDGKLVPIHQQGTRKTIKILTSTRFQWAAIDPGTKKFSGTGGGTYTFKNGKYTENIEFFSRNSSRVGQSLTFDGQLENGAWHHSGKSSANEPIYEIWKRKM